MTERAMGRASNRTREPSPTCSQQTVSDDDEIDYSIKPEFYDSDLDDKDERWVEKKRKSQYSDAVLSCPACFTILCYACQRHEKYVTQYRAIFVVNCKINEKQVFNQETQKRKRHSKRKQKDEVVVQGSSQTSSSSVFQQVCCQVCSTEVGAIDEDEVYHFFDVIPSEP